MPDGTDEIIDRNPDSGESDTYTDFKPIDRNAGGTYKPEVISGYETESPATERFGDADTGGSPRGRRTRSDAGQPRGKRGRPAKGEKESVRLESISLTDLFFSLHMMGAAIVKRPELEIDRDEAKKIADAAQEVGKHYTTAFDPKKIAVLNLIAVLISIYWMRFLAIKNNLEREREEKRLRLTTPINQGRAASAMREPGPDPNSIPTPSSIFGDQAAGL